MVGTACLTNPRTAFSHDRFALGLAISPSIFTMCSRLSSRTRLLAVLGTEFLDDATARASCLVRQIGPLGTPVVGNDQRVDRARLRSARADLGAFLIRNGGQRHLVRRHELFAARQGRQRNRLEAAAAEVIPD